MNNTKRALAAIALAGAALSVTSTVHAADPVPVTGRSLLNPDDALAIEFIRTDVWGGNDAIAGSPDFF